MSERLIKGNISFYLVNTCHRHDMNSEIYGDYLIPVYLTKEDAIKMKET